jgi:hypothetical protein
MGQGLGEGKIRDVRNHIKPNEPVRSDRNSHRKSFVKECYLGGYSNKKEVERHHRGSDEQRANTIISRVYRVGEV